MKLTNLKYIFFKLLRLWVRSSYSS